MGEGRASTMGNGVKKGRGWGVAKGLIFALRFDTQRGGRVRRN